MKAKLLRKLRKRAFKLYKLEFQRYGSYQIRRNRQRTWYGRVKEQPWYLKDFSCRVNGEYQTFVTHSYDKALKQLYKERREYVLLQVVAIRNEKNEKARSEAVAYQNKWLKNI